MILLPPHDDKERDREARPRGRERDRCAMKAHIANNNKQVAYEHLNRSADRHGGKDRHSVTLRLEVLFHALKHHDERQAKDHHPRVVRRQLRNVRVLMHRNKQRLRDQPQRRDHREAYGAYGHPALQKHTDAL